MKEKECCLLAPIYGDTIGKDFLLASVYNDLLDRALAKGDLSIHPSMSVCLSDAGEPRLNSSRYRNNSDTPYDMTMFLVSCRHV